jgi:hypothetical protein
LALAISFGKTSDSSKCTHCSATSIHFGSFPLSYDWFLVLLAGSSSLQLQPHSDPSVCLVPLFLRFPSPFLFFFSAEENKLCEMEDLGTMTCIIGATTLYIQWSSHYSGLSRTS